MSIIILRGGLQTSVQDAGRAGFGRYGVPERGALDSVSLRIANMLVGNAADAAAIEMTLDGAHILFEHAARIAICGADFAPEASGPLPQWRPLEVGAGTVVRFGQARGGARTYLAIAGGIDVPPVLGSRGTHLRSGFGGFEGRMLRAGDRLSIGGERWCETGESRSPEHRSAPTTSRGTGQSPAPAVGRDGAISRPTIDDEMIRAARWSVASEMRTPTDDVQRVRCIASVVEGIDLPVRCELTVAPESDRMGMRFVESLGAHTRSITSEPAVLGAVQVPPDGRPIVLLADHQTTGGYPVIAHVATVDLPRLGQARPGSRVVLERIDREAAQRLLCERERDLRRLSIWIDLQRAQ